MFCVILVYFNIRNTLPKSGTVLLGHPVCVYIYIYIYSACVCVFCVYTHTHIHTYINTYIHTHTHTHTQKTRLRLMPFLHPFLTPFVSLHHLVSCSFSFSGRPLAGCAVGLQPLISGGTMWHIFYLRLFEFVFTME